MVSDQRSPLRTKPPHPMPRLPAVIKKRREALGYTQADVAHFLGISDEAVSRWENGNRMPGGKNLIDLLRLLGLSHEQVT